jgi:hypothetical protein
MGFEVNPEMSQNSLHDKAECLYDDILHSVMTIKLTPVLCHYTAESNWFWGSLIKRVTELKLPSATTFHCLITLLHAENSHS